MTVTHDMSEAQPAPISQTETAEDLRREIVDALEFGYGPALVSLGFAFFLAFADPAHEVILSLGLEAVTSWSDGETILRLAASVLLFALVPVAVYVSLARALAARDPGPGLARRVDGVLLVLFSRLPFAGAAAGLASVAASSEAGPARPLLWTLAAFFGIVVLGLSDRTRDLGFGRLRELFISHARAFLLFVLLVAVLATLAPGASWRLGPVAVASAFVIVAAFGLSELTRLSARQRSRFPLILLLVALTFAGDTAWMGFGMAALILVALFVGNRRRNGRFVASDVPVPYLVFAVLFLGAGVLARMGPDCGIAAGCNLMQGAVADTPPGQAINGQQAVFDWAEQDAPRMRILAAQGGGLYAAYQTAYYLAHRTDTQGEAFADSLFAISGVSGGAVGAAVYWAVRKGGVCDDPAAPDDCHRQAVRQILRHDYLSPPLSGLLFRDQLDTFFPYTVLIGRPIDRGEVLTGAFAARVDACCTFETEEGTLRVSMPEGLLSTAMADAAGPGLPLLLLNATDVHSGESVISTPLRDLAPSDVRTRILLDGDRDLTVGEAMTLSARFPVVTPPGRYVAGGVTRQIVDGGYFDNSGIETVTELLRGTEFARLEVGREAGLERSVPVEILSFRILEEAPPRSMKGTVTAPVSAFQAAWMARRDLTTSRFCSRFGVNRRDSAISHSESVVEADRVNFTVSWLLTDRTFRDIEEQIATPRDLEIEPVCGPGSEAAGFAKGAQ